MSIYHSGFFSVSFEVVISMKKEKTQEKNSEKIHQNFMVIISKWKNSE